MFLKYPKTYRITTPKICLKNKLNLSFEEQRALLRGQVEVTEKMDGANVGIIRHKKGWILQKRRGLADEGIHAQYSFFWNWARLNEERIMSIPVGWIIYGELMFARHHIYYDQLPSYFLCFNVWNGEEFIPKENQPFQTVPTLYRGNELTMEMLDKWAFEKSVYSSENLREGVYVKNYKHQLLGKLVRAEFMKELDEDEDHWMMQKLVKNKLADGVLPSA